MDLVGFSSLLSQLWEEQGRDRDCITQFVRAGLSLFLLLLNLIGLKRQGGGIDGGRFTKVTYAQQRR